MKGRLLKKVAKGVVVLGASALVFAGTANAATFINLYGASAQFNFWANYGCTYLTTVVGCGGCTGPYVTADGNSGVSVGTACPGALAGDDNYPITSSAAPAGQYLPDVANSFDGGSNPSAPSAYVTVTGYAPVTTAASEPNTIYFSYSSKASWDGVDSILGLYDEGNNGFNNPCSDTAGANGINTAYRPVATCDNKAGNCNNPGTTHKGSAKYVCQQIQIGTSDVEAAAFTQGSVGTIFGPLDPGDAQITRSFNGIDVSGLPGKGNGGKTGYKADANSIKNGAVPVNPETPLAYPFSFYVNPGVKNYRCNSSSTGTFNGQPTVDSLCYDDTWCDSTGVAGEGGLNGTAGTFCTAQTIDNLTRLQAVALYSNHIADWSDFGTSFWPAHPVTLCLRHAGSGTTATLDQGIMEMNGYGTQLVGSEARTTGGVAPYVYFNDQTGDMKNCLNWAHGDAVGGDALPAAAKDGAVGYMDSDNGNQPEYVQVKFGGVWGNRYTMHDGIYDNFWTVNRMYVPAGLSQAVVDMYVDMYLTVNTPAKLTNANLGSTRGETYGAFSELNFDKGSSFAYPYSYAIPTVENTTN